MCQSLRVSALGLRAHGKAVECSPADSPVCVRGKIRCNIDDAIFKGAARHLFPVNLDRVCARHRPGIDAVFNPMQVLRKGHVMRMRRNVYAVPMFRQIERLRRNQQADIHLVVVRKFMPMNHAVPVAAEAVRWLSKLCQ